MQQKQPNQFLKYSNMAIQMGLIIGLSAWGGKKLDEYCENKTPFYTATFSLLGVAGGIYVALKDFINPKKQ